MLPTRPAAPGRRAPRAAVALGAVAAAVVLAGCSAGEAPAPPPPPPPPPPPAACLLDTAALAATTGLSWVPDASTASDTRCVYDPAAAGVDTERPVGGPAFIAVEVSPEPDPVAALDAVSALCEDGSRASAEGAADGATDAGPVGDPAGFVCRFQGGSVFAAVARDDRLVTLSASAVPPGTTAARLVVAFDQQVAALGR